MVGVASLAVGIVQLLVLSLVPAALLWLALDGGRLRARLARRWCARDVEEAVAHPIGPPIEQIAADIRRIAAHIDALPSRVQREDAMLAYDDALGAACRALDVVDAVTVLPAGPARDAARARVELELELAGLVIRGPQPA